MILLLGANGFVGQAFARELLRQGKRFVPLSRDAFDYARFEQLFDYVRKIRPEFLINAAGYSERLDEADESLDRFEVLHANSILPQTISRVCLMTNTPWGHVSSGSIFSGAKVHDNGKFLVVPNLNHPETRRRFDRHPEHFTGFDEADEPNFSFRHPPCSFCSGTKALAEEAIRKQGDKYIWRFKKVFDNTNDHRNWFVQLQTSSLLHDGVNSVSHLDDAVRACLELWEKRAPFGIYNITNPGAVTTRQVVQKMKRVCRVAKRFRFSSEHGTLQDHKNKALRSNCILDVSKLFRAGVRMRNVEEALDDALEKWQPHNPTLRLLSSPRASNSHALPLVFSGESELGALQLTPNF